MYCPLESIREDKVPVTFEVFHSSGDPAPGVYLDMIFVDGTSSSWQPGGSRFEVQNPHVLSKLIIHSLGIGHWAVEVTPPFLDSRITLPALPKDGPLGWWHTAIGIHDPDTTRGTGVRVGVIDSGLERSTVDDMLSHVVALGTNEFDRQSNLDADTTPSSHHSNSIASILFSKNTGADGYQGIVPGAHAFFYGARLPARFVQPGRGEGLDPSQLANAVRDLAIDHQCDVIVVSAGDFMQDVDFLHRAIIDAKNAGSLCFVASGNQGGKLLYPACYDEVMSVGAIGKRGFAPSTAFEHSHDRLSDVAVGNDYYLWKQSAVGPDLKFVAPGSNVIWDHVGQSADAVNGTSWAAPIAAGAAAAILSETKDRWTRFPRNQSRWNEMVTILREHSHSLGLSTAIVQFGLLTR